MERKGTDETVKDIKQPRLLTQWKKLIFMAFYCEEVVGKTFS